VDDFKHLKKTAGYFEALAQARLLTDEQIPRLRAFIIITNQTLFPSALPTITVDIPSEWKAINKNEIAP